MKKMNPQHEIRCGYFLQFTSQEEKDLKDFLTENEYPPDKEGLKEFILENIYPNEKPPIAPELETLITNGLTAITRFIKKKARL